jgi:hypothetical protein
MYLQEIPHDHVADNTLKSLVSQTKGTATARAGRLIKEIYEVDPLLYPECGGSMRIIAFIEEETIIRKIPEHLKFWEDQEPRPPPAVPEQVDIQYVPFFDS